MATNGTGSFEIPADMRALAENSVEHAKKAFDGFIAAAHEAVTSLEGHASKTQAGAKEVGKKAIDFAEKNVASSFAFAQKLVQAKDVEEMMRLQAEFVATQIKALGEQARELGESVANAATDTAKPRA